MNDYRTSSNTLKLCKWCWQVRVGRAEWKEKEKRSKNLAARPAYQLAANQSGWCQRERKLDAAGSQVAVAVDTRSLCSTQSTPTGLTQHDAPSAFAQSAALAEAGLDQCHPHLHLVRPSSRRGRAHNRYARPPHPTTSDAN